MKMTKSYKTRNICSNIAGAGKRYRSRDKDGNGRIIGRIKRNLRKNASKRTD
jgi:hypothetical protein